MRNFAPRTAKTKMEKKIVFKNAVNLYNKLLNIYFIDYSYIKKEKNEEMDKKYDSSNFFLEGIKYRILKKKRSGKK